MSTNEDDRPNRFAPTTCRSCKAPIRWVHGLEEGAWMPMDVAPVPSGPWRIEPNAYGEPSLIAAKHATSDLFGDPLRYTSHWANCPDAKDWHARTRERNLTEKRGPGRTP